SHGVVALSIGNYVVRSPNWDNGAVTNAGAVTWGNGNTGISGVVSAANSLVGSSSNDQVGLNANNGGVVALSNGNYVVNSPFWNNGAARDSGAVTWGNGTTGITGVVSAANSLVGSSSGHHVGYDNGAALPNGNYVARSRLWDNGVAEDAGAITLINGSTGLIGEVSAANSLVGSRTNDTIGHYGIPVLTNGNYLVSSDFWDNARGAVTWVNGISDLTGEVSVANSLVGSRSGDFVAGGGAVALSNGNYVVNSPRWDNGTVTDAGAVTWGNGNTGISGEVSVANSLVGSSPNDQVGSRGVTALSNGNYVVSSPNWDNGGVTNAGAVTWVDGGTSITGVVSAANSLVGSNASDQVGSGGVAALTDGNYVVSSPDWNNGIGAATWVNGSNSSSGVVSATNSLVGSNPSDEVGSGGVVALSNGSYLVSSPNWNNGKGAVTWVNGATQMTLDGTNVVSAQNSITGNIADSGMGRPVEDKINGTFLVSFPNEGSGRVTVGLTDPTQITFARGQNATISLAPGFVQSTLDTGTALVLQANNDITIDSPITINNPSGKGGDLTFQTGRSILVNADIVTDNGNLTLIANSSTSSGVMDGFRDPGTAEIRMSDGVTLDSGTGDMVVRLEAGAGLSNNSSGDIVLDNLIARNVLVQNNTGSGGVSLNGDVTASGTVNLTVNGNVATDNITSSSQAIKITSTNGSIDTSAGILNTSSMNGNGGAITLSAAGDLNVNDINSSAEQNAGGIILTTTGGKITTTGIINAAGGSNGGDITISAPGNINTSEITTFLSGFSGDSGNINITSFNGNIDTSAGALITASALGVGGNIILDANKGSITVADINTRSFTSTGGEIQLNAGSQIIASGDIATNDQNITFGVPVTLADNASVTISGTGNIIFNDTIDGTSNLILDTDNGIVQFNDSVGDSTPLNNLRVLSDITTTNPDGIDITTFNNIEILGNITSPGGIDLTSLNRDITTGILDSSNSGDGGDTNLDALGNIIVSQINAQSLGSGTGGNVNAKAGLFFQATESFPDQNNLNASVSTAGGDGGGTIIIRHGGGGITPFIVGNAETNGTSEAITRGNTAPIQTISPTQEYLFTHKQDADRIQIISVAPPPQPDRCRFFILGGGQGRKEDKGEKPYRIGFGQANGKKPKRLMFR
ncbi:MAG: hypothetical protein RLP02_20460, partial [Coleofasciculus sp. C2-GNP5-27]